MPVKTAFLATVSLFWANLLQKFASKVYVEQMKSQQTKSAITILVVMWALHVKYTFWFGGMLRSGTRTRCSLECVGTLYFIALSVSLRPWDLSRHRLIFGIKAAWFIHSTITLFPIIHSVSEFSFSSGDNSRLDVGLLIIENIIEYIYRIRSSDSL